MDSFEVNKIFGAFVGALGVYVALNIITEGIFSHGHHGEHTLAYSLEIEETSAEPEEVVETPPLPVLLASASAGAGERVFNKCKSCHKIEPDGANGVGPALYGVMGRAIGGVDGYNYSDALAGLDQVWDWDAMDGFLEAPKDWAPGTKMGFAGIRDAEERADLLLWMNEQTTAPLDLPAVEEQADAGEAATSAN